MTSGQGGAPPKKPEEEPAAAEPLMKPSSPAPEVQAKLQELEKAEAEITPATEKNKKKAKEEQQRKTDEQEAKVEKTLAQLETMTWTAESDRNVLNLQILLRRKYEDAMNAGRTATASAVPTSNQGTKTLQIAGYIAIGGWCATVACVVGHVFRPEWKGTIAEIWPALAATSGAVLLLVGVATLALRFAYRTHERARAHYDDAAETRRLEAAVRLMLIGNTKDTASELRMFASKILGEPRAAVTPRDDLSAMPDGTTDVLKSAVEKIGEIAKSVIATITPKKD